MIEAIIEFVFEIIFELSIEGLKSKKVPKPIRLIIFIFCFLILFAATIFCLYITLIIDTNVIIKIISFIVAAALCYLLIKLTRLVVEKQEE